jgi:hypothetical protein
MADEAFALSPIHARASLPTDADYDAICEAFMETSRGRWFLTEYAKRNRNSDTRMVLEAIERLEQNLATQRQAQAEAEAQMLAEAQARLHADAQAAQAVAQAEAEPKIDLWPELAKAFTKTRIEIAQRLIQESNEEAYEAIRSSIETIRSVTWALRERGFDSRICDFLDVQVKAITDGYTGLLAESSVAGDTEADVLAAFDALIAHVEGLTKSSDAETEALDAVVDAVADAMSEDDPGLIAADDTAAAPMPEQEPEASIEAAPQPIETAPAEIATTVEVIPAPDADAAFRQIYGDDGDIEIVDTSAPEEPVAMPPTEPEINRQRLYEAKVEPYRVAPAQPQAALADDIEIVDARPAKAEQAAEATAMARDVRAPAATMPQPAPVEPPRAQQPAAPLRPPEPAQSATSQAPAAQASLGQALLASGVIPNPSGRSDPLAPFRRMSQAEKIAFFT